MRVRLEPQELSPVRETDAPAHGKPLVCETVGNALRDASKVSGASVPAGPSVGGHCWDSSEKNKPTPSK